MAGLNVWQRIILAIAGVLLVLYGMDVANGYGETDGWRALAMYLIAVVFFVVAAGNRSKSGTE